MGFIESILLYCVLGAILVAVGIIIVRRRIKARKRYALLTEAWRTEGYERTAVSKGRCAALWQNRAKGSLICVRENTERFKVLSYTEIKSFSVYEGDVMIVSGDIGGAVSYGSDRSPAKKKKSEEFLLLVRQTDGEVTELIIFDDTVPRESREYDEERRTVEHFISVMLEIKTEAETLLALTPKDTVVESDEKESVEGRLSLLRELCDKGLISKEQYQKRSAQILEKI